jgi:hypothetical protein
LIGRVQLVKLTDLLWEITPAAKEAKRRGLLSVGFGRYVDPKDPHKVVAKIVNGKLVAVKGKEKPKDKKAPIKPPVEPETDPQRPQQYIIPGMVGKKTVVSVGVNTLKDFKEGSDPGGFIASETIKGEQTIIHALNILKEDVGNKPPKGFEKSQVMYYQLIGSADFNPFGVSSHVTDALAPLRQANHDAVDESWDDAGEQTSEWRTSLPIRDLEGLLDIQTEWQGQSQYQRPEYERKERNHNINEVCSGELTNGNPPEITVPLSTGFIERGMQIPPEKLEAFLRNFEVGKDVILPPSGFSADLSIARDFAAMRRGYAGRKVGVLLRIRPAEGSDKMVGLHLSNSSDLLPNKEEIADIEQNEPVEPDQDDFTFEDEETGERLPDEAAYEEAYINWETEHDEWERELEEMQSRWDSIDSGEFDEEREIIRPGTVQQKVVSVKKHVFPFQTPPSIGEPRRTNDDISVDKANVFYEIEMIDTGQVPPEQYAEWVYGLRDNMLNEKEGTLKKMRDALGQFVSTRVAQVERETPEKKALRKHVSTRIAQKER